MTYRLRAAVLAIAAALSPVPVVTASAPPAVATAAPAYVQMADSAFAPSPTAIAAAGVQAWAGYVPSPSVYHAWSARDFATVMSRVPELAVYVVDQGNFTPARCSAEGVDAVHQLQAYHLHHRVAADVEYGSYQSNQVGAAQCVRAWAASVRAGGMAAFVYGPLGLSRRLAVGDVDGYWLADWLGYSVDPEGPPLDLYRWVGHRGVQYRGGHQVAGVDLDSSAVDVGLVGAAPARNPYGVRLRSPIVATASVPTLAGASWEASANGDVYALGGAPYFGGTGGLRLHRAIVAIAGTPDGLGYWLVAGDGGVFPFGDACGCGSASTRRLNRPVIGIVPTSTGRGYALVAGDGGVFNFGDSHVVSLVP